MGHIIILNGSVNIGSVDGSEAYIGASNGCDRPWKTPTIAMEHG